MPKIILSKKKKTVAITVAVAVLLIAATVSGIAFRPEISDIFSNASIKTEYKESEISVGDVIEFGLFEQDNNPLNGREKIRWTVIDIIDGKAFLVAENIIDYMPYNESDSDTTWETSSLRSWLNGTFYEDAFTSRQKKIINKTLVDIKNDETFNINPGNDTYDYLFLISTSDMENYPYFSENKSVEPTPYAMEKEGENLEWWLISTGYNQDEAAYVTGKGSPYKNGTTVTEELGIRPCMQIVLE